jgi:hypothetical protein
MADPSDLITLVITALSLAFQPAALAQIASPINAGLNSGNNTLGSSINSLSTPNFSAAASSLVSGLTVEEDGTITATPEQLDAVEDAIRSTTSQPVGQMLAPIEIDSGSSRLELASLEPPQALLVSSEIPEARSQAQALAQAANVADQLMASGLESTKANQLATLLVSLAQRPNLNQLSYAINLFNQVVRDTNPEVQASLRINPAFVAISTTLRAARAALGN